MNQQFALFLVRWALNSLGIWVAVRLFGPADTMAASSTAVATFVLAGLVFSLINSVLKPIITILSLPFILLTLGLFTLVVNGVVVYVSLLLVPGLHMTFADSILAGIVLSLVNYIVSGAFDTSLRRAPKNEE